MPHPCYHHGQFMFFAIFYGIIVSYGSARLNKSSDAGIMPHLHTIIEGEEGVAGHDGPDQVEIKLPGFFNSLSQRIDTTCLPATFADKLFVLYKCNSITLEMLAD